MIIDYSPDWSYCEVPISCMRKLFKMTRNRRVAPRYLYWATISNQVKLTSASLGPKSPKGIASSRASSVVTVHVSAALIRLDSRVAGNKHVQQIPSVKSRWRLGWKTARCVLTPCLFSTKQTTDVPPRMKHVSTMSHRRTQISIASLLLRYTVK